MFGTMSIITSVLAVGVGLATLIITMIRGLRRDLDARMDGLDARVRTLEITLARLTGLLEGLGLTGRARPDPDPEPAN